MQKSHDITSKKEILKILAVTTFLGLTIFIYDFVNNRINFDSSLLRNSAGSGNTNIELEAEYDDETSDIVVEVSEQGLSDEELEANFDKAIDEINASFLGENTDASNVYYDLNLKDSYVDGLIKASFSFDNYRVISSEGKINEEKLDDENIVRCVATLSYGEKTKEYGFSIVIKPYEIDTKEGKLKAIEDAVVESDESTILEKTMELPQKIAGMDIRWKKKLDYRGLELILLGFVAAAGMILGQKNDEKKAKEALLQEKIQDYPLIVSQLSILMGAGMSFRGALEKICNSYLKKTEIKEKRAGYEDIVATYRSMSDGLGEVAAIEALSRRTESKEYRKLCLLLTQNLKKGSKDLLNALEKEEQVAFELRKQSALKQGEVASTKLLIPMTGMLFIVIVILIVPAMMQMNI